MMSHSKVKQSWSSLLTIKTRSEWPRGAITSMEVPSKLNIAKWHKIETEIEHDEHQRQGWDTAQRNVLSQTEIELNRNMSVHKLRAPERVRDVVNDRCMILWPRETRTVLNSRIVACERINESNGSNVRELERDWFPVAKAPALPPHCRPVPPSIAQRFP